MFPGIIAASRVRASQSTEIMHLGYNPTTSLNLMIQTASDDDWEIDWGDGVWVRYTSAGTHRTKTFGSVTSGVARVRSATGRELSDLHWVDSYVGTWRFDVADLCATYIVWFEGESMAITGDVADIKATSTARFVGDSMTLTGGVGTIKATWEAMFIGNSMTLTGSPGDIKTTFDAHFQGDSMELTYTTQTWTKIPAYSFLLDLASGHLTTAELSQMLIDMDDSGITGSATLDFRYNNGGPNALGEIAADNLRAKGYTVLTNVTETMELSYNPTTSLNLMIQTVSGDRWEIDWGDGVWVSYVSSGTAYRTKTFGSSTSGVAKVRSATGKELSDLHRVQSNVGTWSFDVADLCATYQAYFRGDSMAITGDVADIKATFNISFQGDSMTLTGDVGDINATWSVRIEGTSMALTYTTKTWTHIPLNSFLLDLATGHLSTAELSQMLIDMDASGITGSATLDFRYNNGAPNTAGAIAADNLRAKGYTVLTNTETMYLSYDPTTAINLYVGTASGDDWEIDWGDGVWERYASGGSYKSKTFGSSTSGVARVRSATGKGLSDFRVVQSNGGTWSFDVADLHASYQARFDGHSMALTGDVANIKATYYARFQGNIMTLTGDVGDIKATYYAHFHGIMTLTGDISTVKATYYTYFSGSLMTLTGDISTVKATNTARFAGSSMTLTGDVGTVKADYFIYFSGNLMTLTGDVGTIKASATIYIIGSSMELTYTTQTWTKIPTGTVILNLAPGRLTTTELSQMLVDMDASGITVSGTLDVRYQNGGPNAAGAIAADNLRAKGYTVLTNAVVPTYDADFQAWIEYNRLQGHYLPDETKLDAANQYVLDSKADGTWSGKDVFHIFAWNDLQMDDASLVCLKRLVKVDVYGGMIYTVNGWQGNGVDGYISTGFSGFDGNYKQNTAGIGAIQYRSLVAAFHYIVGLEDSQANQFISRNTNGHKINGYNLLNTWIDFTGIGLMGFYRDTSNNIRGYNKDTETISTSSSSANYKDSEYLLFRSANVYSIPGLSSFFIGRNFTSIENESIRTNLNSYLTSIGLTAYA